MAEQNKHDVDAFLADLAEVSRKHDLWIAGWGEHMPCLRVGYGDEAGYAPYSRFRGMGRDTLHVDVVSEKHYEYNARLRPPKPPAVDARDVLGVVLDTDDEKLIAEIEAMSEEEVRAKVIELGLEKDVDELVDRVRLLTGALRSGV